MAKKSAFKNYLKMASLIGDGDFDQFKEIVKKMSLDELAESMSDANTFYTEFNNNPESTHKSWRNCFEFIWHEVCELRPKIKKNIFNWGLTSLIDPKTPDYVIQEMINFSLKHDPVVTVGMIELHLSKGLTGLNGEKPNKLILLSFIENLKSENISVHNLIDLIRLQQRYRFEPDLLFKVINKIDTDSINLNPLFEYVMQKISKHHSFKNDLLQLIDKKNGLNTSLYSQYQCSAIEIDDINSYGFSSIESFETDQSISLFEKRFGDRYSYILEYKNSRFILSKYEIEVDCEEEIYINKQIIDINQDCKTVLSKAV